MQRALDAFEAWLGEARARRYLTIGGGLWLALLVYVVAAGKPPLDVYGHVIGGDFAAHFIGGRFALRGEWSQLYDLAAQARAQVQEIPGAPANFHDAYISPPAAALIYAPFARLPFLGAYAAWVAFSVLLTVASGWLIGPLLPRWLYESRTARLSLFLSAPFVETCYAGQDAAVSLFLFAAGLRMLQARRDLLAGLILGLGAYKPQLFMLVPVALLSRRRLAALAGMGVSGGAVLSLSVALVGTAGLRAYGAALSSDVYRNRIVLAMNWKMLSIPALFRGILPASFEGLARPIAVLLALIVAAWYYRALRRAAPPTELPGLAAAQLLAIVVSPHAFAYDGLLLSVPVAFLVAQRVPRVRATLGIFFALSWLMPSLDSAAKVLALRCPPLVALVVLAFAFLAARSLERGEGEPLAHGEGQ